MKKFKIGTRGSPLALRQAEIVLEQLVEQDIFRGDTLDVISYTTSGDQLSNHSLRDFGGKGLFTKEIDSALLDGDIDVGVHSAKDLPGIIPDGLDIIGYLPREDVRDVFLSIHHESIEDLPEKVVIGTASLRRQALVKARRPDLEVVNFRGNVQTRLKKLSEGEVAGTLLAVAGLNRLDIDLREQGVHAVELPIDEFYPAIGQGAICLICRKGDDQSRDVLLRLCDKTTGIQLACERAFLKVIDGNCRTPLAGLARVSNDTLTFKGMLMHPTSGYMFEHEMIGSISDPTKPGEAVADYILSHIEPKILAEIQALYS